VVDFFIRRPVFATVCALLIILAGAVCIPTLPISLYPTLAPPQVTVTSNYVGANAQTVESAVTIPLEQQINGVQGMRYISSTSSNDGTSSILTTFQTGYSLDIAAVDVQNRVSAATGRLPAGGEQHRHHHHQDQQQLRIRGCFLFSRQSLFRPVYQQLPRRLCEGRAQAHPWCGRCGDLRRAPVCHAAMARSRRNWRRAA
jgi:multidrug efflux pump subunit AcrB